MCPHIATIGKTAWLLNRCYVNRNILTHDYIKGDAKKKFQNVLLNNTKLINLRVQPQAKGPANFLISLK